MSHICESVSHNYKHQWKTYTIKIEMRHALDLIIALSWFDSAGIATRSSDHNIDTLSIHMYCWHDHFQCEPSLIRLGESHFLLGNITLSDLGLVWCQVWHSQLPQHWFRYTPVTPLIICVDSKYINVQVEDSSGSFGVTHLLPHANWITASVASFIYIVRLEPGDWSQ